MKERGEQKEKKERANENEEIKYEKRGEQKKKKKNE